MDNQLYSDYGNDHSLKVQRAEQLLELFSTEYETHLSLQKTEEGMDVNQLKILHLQWLPQILDRYQRSSPFTQGSSKSIEFLNKLQEKLEQIFIKIAKEINDQSTETEDSWREASAHSFEYYKNVMKVTLESVDFLEDAEVEKVHERAYNETVEEFESYPKIGWSLSALDIKYELKGKIKKAFEDYKCWNHQRRVFLESDAESCFSEAEALYDLLMQMDMSEPKSVWELKELHEKSKTAALEKLVEDCSIKNDDIMKKYSKQLEDKIERNFEELKDFFELRVGMERTETNEQFAGMGGGQPFQTDLLSTASPYSTLGNEGFIQQSQPVLIGFEGLMSQILEPVPMASITPSHNQYEPNAPTLEKVESPILDDFMSPPTPTQSMSLNDYIPTSYLSRPSIDTTATSTVEQPQETSTNGESSEMLALNDKIRGLHAQLEFLTRSISQLQNGEQDEHQHTSTFPNDKVYAKQSDSVGATSREINHTTSGEKVQFEFVPRPPPLPPVDLISCSSPNNCGKRSSNVNNSSTSLPNSNSNSYIDQLNHIMRKTDKLSLSNPIDQVNKAANVDRTQRSKSLSPSPVKPPLMPKPSLINRRSIQKQQNVNEGELYVNFELQNSMPLEQKDSLAEEIVMSIPVENDSDSYKSRSFPTSPISKPESDNRNSLLDSIKVFKKDSLRRVNPNDKRRRHTMHDSMLQNLNSLMESTLRKRNQACNGDGESDDDKDNKSGSDRDDEWE